MCVHPSQTRHTSVKIDVSGSSPCYVLFLVPLPVTWNSFLTHDEVHDGVSRVRNTNVPELTSENMWYQHILIQLLTVLLLLQPHIHFSSCFSRGFLTKRKEEGVQIGLWCSQYFTTKNTNTWLRTGVRHNNFGRSILKNPVPKKLG